MSDDDPQRWEDDYSPHDPERAAAQLQGIQTLLSPGPKRVLDLGCGDGRLLIPLAVEGHAVVGVDRDPHALEHCLAGLTQAGVSAGSMVQSDFTAPGWHTKIGEEPFDAILCLGNTFMTLCDVERALALVAQCARLLVPGGMLVLDDFPHDLWTELTEGNWQSGVSVDGSMQMVWKQGDAVFAIRHGDEVDESSWTVERSDQPLRLWSMGALRLLALAGGLSVPERLPGEGLILMRTSESASAD